MYIRAYHGPPAPTAPVPPPLSRHAAPPRLQFFRLDNFATNQATLTPALLNWIERIAQMVRNSWTTAQPIGTIRLVGHTDSTGEDKFNAGLGQRRAEAVYRELHKRLGGALNRAAIDIDPSPGPHQPVASNTTAAGRGANRRVDISLGPPIPPAAPWPQGPRITGTTPDPDKGAPWDPYWFRRGLPTGPLQAKSVRQFLMEVCEPVFGSRCKDVVDKAIAGGCKAVAMLLEQFGARVNDKQKEEVLRQCRESAGQRVR
jgi:outer membrane protein OmpA-like peptidoglycan-associated protein